MSGTLRQVGVYLSEASSPPRFLSSNFVGFESGHMQSVKLLQNMVSNRTQHPHPHPPAKHCLYILYFDTGKGGGLNQREVREAKVHKNESKIPT